MAAVIPTAGGFPHFASRFIDPALGFALGWNCESCAVELCDGMRS
jgi:amino acid permease